MEMEERMERVVGKNVSLSQSLQVIFKELVLAPSEKVYTIMRKVVV
jgi:hypothetical protein